MMRAAVLEGFGGPEVLKVRSSELPEPDRGEVRVRVHAAALQRTRDVATRTGSHPFSRAIAPPHILGGECAGMVDKIGADVVAAIAVGERVAISSAVVCGSCPACRAGRDEACEELELIGIHRAGTHAGYAIAPAENIVAIPADLDYREAAVLAATGPVAYAQLEAAAVGAGSRVAIPGSTGALGSTVAALALKRGAEVLALERPGVLARAANHSLHFTEMISTDSPDLGRLVQRATRGEGIDAAIDNLGVPDVWRACVENLAPLGRVVISGAIGTAPLQFDPMSFYLRCNSIIGIRTAGRRHRGSFWEEVAAGFRLPEGLITSFPLEAVAEAHAQIEQRRKLGHFALDI